MEAGHPLLPSSDTWGWAVTEADLVLESNSNGVYVHSTAPWLPHTGMAVQRRQSQKIPAWGKVDSANGKGLRDDDGTV